jgi:uncharacterized protein (DUF1810 family)
MDPNSDPFGLQRFVDAQDGVFDQALAELTAGAKRSHWMWFVFPQIAGLGESAMSRRYAIRSLDEARAYLRHPLLGPRLRQSVDFVLPWAAVHSAEAVFGPVDTLKFRSSLTLFAAAAPDERLFADALAVYYGSPDPRTLDLLGAARA